MANIVTNVRDYCTLLSRSKLLPADEVDGLYRRWRDESRGTDEAVDPFRRFLVKSKSLTEYQSVMLQRGHADGFFLSGYKVLDRIGKGQMAGVYKAVHNLGQTVALKILPASKAKDSQTLSRFQREARLLTQVDHPNVLRAFQLGESGGVNFIVMEYLDGETLDDVLGRRKRLPAAEALRLIHQAFNGLQHLHERRMIHRDMKPANLMLTPAPATARVDVTWDATLKIVDIGLGRELFDENTPEGQIETQLTTEGAVLGTPDYLAPEQARDARTADIRADIYSLGCVLYHCLTGKPPFPDTNIMSQMVKHATEKPKPIAGAAPDAPPGLQAVLDVMMAKDPNQRYSTPAHAANALQPYLKPNVGAQPAGPEVVPAFREWLESTSMELPKDAMLQPAPSKGPKPGTGPSPAFGSPAPVSFSAPTPNWVPAPAAPPPQQFYPAPQAAYPAPPAAYPAPPAYSPPHPAYGAPPTAYPAPPSYPKPIPAPYPPPIEEVNVEVVEEPMPAPVNYAPPAELPQPMPREVPVDRRSLGELNRRDFLMLGGGGLGVLLAVGGGYALAQIFRRNKAAVPESGPEDGK